MNIGTGINRPINATTLLPSNFTVPTDGAFHHVTGLTITLPIAGTYRIDSVIRSGITVTAGVDYMIAKLWNDTAGEYILSTEVMLAYQNGAGTNQISTGAFGYVTVTEPTVLIVDAKLNATSAGSIYGNANGQTYLSYALQR